MSQQSKSVKSSKKTTAKETKTSAKSKQLAKERRVEEKVKAEAVRRGRKTGVILSVVLVILILIGIGFFIWYFAYYNQPTKVAADAAQDLIQSDDIMLNGEISFTLKNVEDGGLQKIVIALNSSANQAPSTSNMELRLIYQNGGIINYQLGTILLQDGTAYLRVSGIMDAIEAAGAGEGLRVYAYGLYSMFELIDNEWWQISIPDLISSLELPTEDAKKLNATYDCIVNAAQEDQAAEIAQFYKRNSFINLDHVKENRDGEMAAKGSSYYRVTVDYDNLAQFINFLPEAPVAEAIYSCVNQNIKGVSLASEDFNEISADDLKEILPLNSEVFMEISNWQHRLKSVTAQIIDNSYTVDLDFNIQHGAIAISLPESYRPISDLIDEISEIFSMFFIEPTIETGEIEYLWD